MNLRRLVIFLLAAFSLMGCVPERVLNIPSPTPTLEPTLIAKIIVTSSPTETRLAPTRTAADLFPECIIATGYRNGRVNVREGPGIAYQVIEIVLEGTSFTILETAILETEEAWYKIKLEGNEGYIYSEFCLKGV